MSHTKKIVIILTLLSVIVMCINTFAFAIDDPNYYNPGELNDRKIGNIIGDILANIKVVGICIAVVMLTIIGLKYIICSVDEKATYKENMIPYVVGCFLLASATTIPSIVYDLVNK